MRLIKPKGRGEDRKKGGDWTHKSDRMSKLRLEKNKQRAAGNNTKQQDEAIRHEGIRKKTEERSSKLQTKKRIARKRPGIESDPPRKISEQRGSSSYETIAMDIGNDLRGIIESKSSSPERNRQLEEKRQRSIFQKRARLEQQARIAKEKELALECRRAENVAMKSEDSRAQAVEDDAKKRACIRARKARLNQEESCMMFKCMHEMKGRRFLISVYTRNAHGYDLEGLRIVAYDPSSSATFSMVMTLREFNSLGYGRTRAGLEAFCKWLCLLYEKRRRQFRLVWSGVPCPPPLRVRENDQALVCIHKEGIKMRHTPEDWYSLVAVYLRTDDQATLRFVMSSWRGQEVLLAENALAARTLITGSDLDVQWKSSGHATIVWKHNSDGYKSDEASQDDAGSSLISAVGPRIYSSEFVINRVRYSVNVYDTSETTYTVELIPKSKKDKNVQEAMHLHSDPLANRVSLHKRKVNPYSVHLSSSSFADLLSLTHFESVPFVTDAAELKDSDHSTHSIWKATVSPKWANKLANYVRVLHLAKYACKISGAFCFVAVFVVQQKTEFRAHLLLEFTWLCPILSSSFALGGVVSRQSLRIALSDYLRCGNASRRFAVGLGRDKDIIEGEEECPSCLAYSVSCTRFYDRDICPVSETAFDYSASCSTCAMIQNRRLSAINELITQAGAIAPESLELIYHGYCDVCATLAPPIVLVLGSAVSSTTIMWLLPFFEHYFASFNCNKDGFLHFAAGEESHSIAEEGLPVRESLLQRLARDQVAVLFNADCGVTVSSANLFVYELHWWLYPEHSDLPCHVAYVVGDLTDDGRAGMQRDSDLLEALRALSHAACEVAKQDPVHLDNGSEEQSDHASAFDAYLVAEAVLVEATQILLHPGYAWQKPRKIIGASSWSTACSFLLDPVRLSFELQRCDPIQLRVESGEVLEAYFAHAKWPHDYPCVRPFFYGLLGFMLHVQHVRQILAFRSGSLHGSLTRDPVIEGDTNTGHELLAKNTSVINCSHLGST